MNIVVLQHEVRQAEPETEKKKQKDLERNKQGSPRRWTMSHHLIRASGDSPPLILLVSGESPALL